MNRGFIWIVAPGPGGYVDIEHELAEFLAEANLRVESPFDPGVELLGDGGTRSYVDAAELMSTIAASASVCVVAWSASNRDLPLVLRRRGHDGHLFVELGYLQEEERDAAVLSAMMTCRRLARRSAGVFFVYDEFGDSEDVDWECFFEQGCKLGAHLPNLLVVPGRPAAREREFPEPIMSCVVDNATALLFRRDTMGLAMASSTTPMRGGA